MYLYVYFSLVISQKDQSNNSYINGAIIVTVLEKLTTDWTSRRGDCSIYGFYLAKAKRTVIASKRMDNLDNDDFV
jgi:hypothetical protein